MTETVSTPDGANNVDRLGAEVDRLAGEVAALRSENAKLKTLIAVAYDERDHWHDWFRRKEKWANIWRRAAKTYRRLPVGAWEQEK